MPINKYTYSQIMTKSYNDFITLIVVGPKKTLRGPHAAHGLDHPDLEDAYTFNNN